MIGLDTNVLIRFLTEDDPVQARKAASAIRTAVARGLRCYIGPIVLCEVVWVLRGAYDIAKPDLLVTVERLLATSQFVIGEKDAVRRALERYRVGRADFSDYLLGELHAEAGCDRTVTFDRRLRGQAQFQLL